MALLHVLNKNWLINTIAAQNLGVPTSIPYLSLSPDSNNTDEYLAGVSFASGGAGVFNSTNSVSNISMIFKVGWNFVRKVLDKIGLKAPVISV